MAGMSKTRRRNCKRKGLYSRDPGCPSPGRTPFVIGLHRPLRPEAHAGAVRAWLNQVAPGLANDQSIPGDGGRRLDRGLLVSDRTDTTEELNPMSLLHRGTETITVFPEETYTDADGNTGHPTLSGRRSGPCCGPADDLDGGCFGRIRDREQVPATARRIPRCPRRSEVELSGKASGTASTGSPGSTTALAVPLTLTT